MEDSLLQMGLGFLVKNAVAVVRVAGSKALARLPKPVWNWGSLRGGSARAITSTPLPPGARVPLVVRNTPRPIRPQERPDTCGAACVKMVVETIKRQTQPEAFYQTLARKGLLDECAYAPGKGIPMSRLARSLQALGIKATLRDRLNRANIQELEAAVRDGYPAIAHLGPAKDGHFVIVDAFVQDSAGNWFVLMRDPLNLDLLEAGTKSLLEESGFRNFPVYSLSDFLTEWSGGAIFTGP